jgi:hypothetical protein
MGFMFSCEGVSFSLDFLFFLFPLGWDRYKIEVGINQLDNKMEKKVLSTGEEVELGITRYSSMQTMILYHRPSTNTLTM